MKKPGQIGEWRFLIGSSTFPEDQLRELGATRELWPMSESVLASQS